MASIKIFQKNKQLANGECPIFLRITKDRKKKLIALGYSCKPNQWSSAKSEFKKNLPNHVQKNLVLSELKSKALSIIDGFRTNSIDFTLSQFEEAFRGGKSTSNVNVYQHFTQKIENLKTAGQVGNATVYKDTRSSFFGFTKNKRLRFEDITPSLLEKYEIYLKSRGGTNGGVSNKMRTIRAIYNDAIDKDYAKLEHYPFRKYKISKLKAESVKRALAHEEVKQIVNFPLDKYPHLTDARNYFVFSYYTRGMNFVDMLHLKWSDIINDTITYKRAKTHKNFVVKVLPPVRTILNYYEDDLSTEYVFPILLKDNLTPSQIQNRKKKVLKKYNKGLKEIGQILGISIPLTSYVARHSYATNLKQKGVSIAVISESLGHKSEEVTETYLKAFENSVLDEATEKLL